MIDIHSHIIPNVDDGAQSWEEAVTMCRMAWEDGTEVMVATPHVFNGLYEHNGVNIGDQMEALKERLLGDGVALEVRQGAEVYCRPDLASVLEVNPDLTLNAGGRYFLLEFPHSAVPPNADQLILELVAKNLIPIIVHPERNFRVQGNIELLENFIRLGALCQITAMSLTGGFGLRARKCANELLDKGCVHVIASDAHGEKWRSPILSEAHRYVSEHFGTQKARELFVTFPEKILSGEW